MEHPENNTMTSQEEKSSVHYSLSAEDDTPVTNGRFHGNDLLLKTDDKPKNHYCTNCGHLLPTDCKFCPNCGHKVEVLSPPPPPPLQSSPYTIQREPSSSWMKGYTPPSAPKKQSQVNIKTVLIIAGVLLAIVIIILIADSIFSDSDLTPVSEPRSGEILSGVEDYYGSAITITASRGESCVVKLKTPSGITRLSFYVRAGDTVTVSVPREYLYVYFASGSTWYGTEHLFGKRTSYSMDDELLDFSEGTWKYTLYPVSSGNFSETPIDADDFK